MGTLEYFDELYLLDGNCCSNRNITSKKVKRGGHEIMLVSSSQKQVLKMFILFVLAAVALMLPVDVYICQYRGQQIKTLLIGISVIGALCLLLFPYIYYRISSKLLNSLLEGNNRSQNTNIPLIAQVLILLGSSLPLILVTAFMWSRGTINYYQFFFGLFLSIIFGYCAGSLAAPLISKSYINAYKDAFTVLAPLEMAKAMVGGLPLSVQNIISSNPSETVQAADNYVRSLAEHNPFMMDVYFAFAENFVPGQKYNWPGYIRKNGKLVPLDIDFAEYDYLNPTDPIMDWYHGALKDKGIHITEPYFDEGATNSWTLSVTTPVYNPGGKLIGVIGGDLALKESEALAARMVKTNAEGNLLNNLIYSMKWKMVNPFLFIVGFLAIALILNFNQAVTTLEQEVLSRCYYSATNEAARVYTPVQEAVNLVSSMPSAISNQIQNTPADHLVSWNNYLNDVTAKHDFMLNTYLALDENYVPGQQHNCLLWVRNGEKAEPIYLDYSEYD